MKFPSRLLGAAIILLTSSAYGFELATHALLAQQSFERFLRERPGILSDFGFTAPLDDPRTLKPFGIHFFDMGSPLASPPQRDANEFEATIIDKIDDAVPETSITGWVMTGAIREDDYPGGDNPRNDDPYGEIVRSYRHFYDPVFDRPLTVGGALGEPSPTWATGALYPFGQPNQADPNRRNHFTILDVKEALFRALTLKTSTGIGWTDLPQPSDAVGKAAMRNAYWATTFRALGDVLHLVQDMAQPQHTRNDAHSGLPAPFTGHASVFESYLDARARRLNAFEIKSDYLRLVTAVPIVLAPLPLNLCDGSGKNCGDYPTPVGFTQYSQFFSTSPGSAVGGKGLADYSNTQFFSAGKNLGNPVYASPPNNVSVYTVTAIPPRHWDGSPVTGGSSSASVYLFSRGVVIDNQNLAYNASNVPLTSFSIWDEFMQGRSIPTSFHLTRENYDVQAQLLLPRAVAYGTGLLQRIFRGNMKIDLPKERAYAVIDNAAPICKDNCGFNKLKLMLTNKTPNETMGSGSVLGGSGSLFAVLKFHRNGCYQPDLSGDPGGTAFAGFSCRSNVEEIVVSNPVDMSTLPSELLEFEEQQPITFTFATPLPINATDILLQVVFRGWLGNEANAIIVATKNISEPNYVAYVNDRDYVYNDANDTFQSVAPDPQTQTITNISMMLGNATTPIATLAQLGVRGYAQIAFLTDIPATGTQKVTVYASVPVPGGPSIYDMPISTFDSSVGTVYERLPGNVIQYRGMWSDFRLDNFQGNNIYEVAICFSGDTRRICTSAGLSPITSANAVPWTLNFP